MVIKKINIETETIKAALDTLPQNADPRTVFEFLFERNLIHTKKCQYALIRRHYYDLMAGNKDLKSIDAKEITAEDFGVSVSQVEKAIYYYTKVEI